jgi:hypothetical protein
MVLILQMIKHVVPIKLFVKIIDIFEDVLIVTFPGVKFVYPGLYHYLCKRFQECQD